MTPEAEAEIARIEADATLTEAQQLERLKPVEQKLFDAQMTKNGKLIGDLSGLNPEEANFAREQLAQGKTVEVVSRGAGRTPDFVIDGQRVELKTLSGVADTTSDGISKAIANRVMNGRGQATDIVVDARGQAGITQEIAQRGIRRAYGADNATGGKITSIRVIGPGFDITVPRI
jgi:filamentous hemagglutinin